MSEKFEKTTVTFTQFAAQKLRLFNTLTKTTQHGVSEEMVDAISEKHGVAEVIQRALGKRRKRQSLARTSS